jgi:hypothetical protein
MNDVRCVVCGSPMDNGAMFEKDVRKSETCSQECFEIFMTEDGVTEECECGYLHSAEKCPYRKEADHD